ncbi:MAG: DUF669 domain-containing protein [Candidatus Nanopelagicales bacterium]
MTDYDLAADYASLGEELAPPLLPNGPYNAVVKRAVPGTTAAGKGRIVVTCEILDGPYAGREIVQQLTWSPESEVARRIFRQALAVLGASHEWVLQTSANMATVAERITGAHAQIQVSEKSFNGEPRNEVNFRKPLPTSTPQAMSLGGPPQPPAPATPMTPQGVPVQQPAPAAAAQPAQGQWPSL